MKYDWLCPETRRRAFVNYNRRKGKRQKRARMTKSILHQKDDNRRRFNKLQGIEDASREQR